MTQTSQDAAQDAAPSGEAPSGDTVRVLVVDDQADMLAMMRLLLSRRSYAVETANNGSEALQRARDFKPQIVVSDIAMPDMSGYALMTQLRQLQECDGLMPFKAIALSGYGMDEDRERAHQAGFDVHLTKPIDFDRLYRTMEELTQ